MKPIRFLLFILFCTMFACTKDKNVDNLSGTIHGVISDHTTGEPITTAVIKLVPGGKSNVTGTDGRYDFENLEEGSYMLYVSKQGYDADSISIEVKAGEQAAGHLLMERIPAALTTNCDTLDFGGQAGVNTLAFNIINNGYENLEWEIDGHCDWITKVKPSCGVIKYGDTETISVMIDRGKLTLLEEFAVIVVRSSSKGSCSVVVKAALSTYKEGWKELAVGTGKVAVQLTDVGVGSRKDMSDACKYSRMGGYDDWRLPSREELTAMYESREIIGDFCNQPDNDKSYYWSSDFYNHTGTLKPSNGSLSQGSISLLHPPLSPPSVVIISSDYYYLNFNNGHIESVSRGDKFYSARCVRTLDKD